MSSSNRPALLNKIRLALRKRYKPAVPRGDQPVLETLLFACCLENAPHDVADRVFKSLQTSFFDWNEIRVTTVKELAEVMSMLPDPAAAAGNLKGVLQSTFESEYAFELESIKKKNLGDAIKRLQKLEGVSPFVIAYATQASLGGHSIPIDRGALSVLYILGAITEAEQAAHQVPGLERAIPKNKGVEFGSLLHEASAEFMANPFANGIRDWMSTVTSDAKERFPKRAPKKAPEPPPAPPTPPKPVATAKKAPTAPTPPMASKKKESPPPPAKKTTSPKPAPTAKKKPAPSTPPKKSTAKTLAKRKPR